MQSIEGSFIAVSRYIAANWGDLSWFPLWYGGIPWQNAYWPLLPLLTAALSTVTDWSAALSFHVLCALFYCLGPTALFLMARRLSDSTAWSLENWTDRPGQDRSRAGRTHLRWPCRPGRGAQTAQGKGPAVAAARAGVHQQDRSGSIPGVARRAGSTAGLRRANSGVGPAIDLRSGAALLRYRTLAGPGPVRP